MLPGQFTELRPASRFAAADPGDRFVPLMVGAVHPGQSGGWLTSHRLEVALQVTRCSVSAGGRPVAGSLEACLGVSAWSGVDQFSSGATALLVLVVVAAAW